MNANKNSHEEVSVDGRKLSHDNFTFQDYYRKRPSEKPQKISEKPPANSYETCSDCSSVCEDCFKTGEARFCEDHDDDCKECTGRE